MIDLAAIAARDERRAEQRRRMAEVTDTAAADSAEIVARQIAKSDPAMSEERYTPSTAAAIADALGATIYADPSRINLARLYIDCKRAAGRWAKKHKNADRDELIADSMQLILRWERHGIRRTPLGPVGGLPRRRDWLVIESKLIDGKEAARYTNQLTAAAWQALHAAIKQAAAAPTWRAMIEERETVAVADTAEQADAIDLGTLALMESGTFSNAERLPGAASILAELPPRVVADRLGCTLNGGRAIIARACPELSTDDLTLAWSMTRDMLKKSLSVGASDLRRLWPNPSDLLDAIDHAADDLALVYLSRRVDRPEPYRAVLRALRDKLADAAPIASSIIGAIENADQSAQRDHADAPKNAPPRWMRRAERRRASLKLDAAELAKLDELRAELGALLERGASDADRAAELRAAILASLKRDAAAAPPPMTPPSTPPAEHAAAAAAWTAARRAEHAAADRADADAEHVRRTIASLAARGYGSPPKASRA